MPIVSGDVTVQANPNKDADLTAKKAGDLALATVHLFVNDIVPDGDTVVADFVECADTAYTPQVVAGWTANDPSPDGSISTTSTNVMSWVGSGDDTGGTVYGYYVKSAGGGTPLIYSVRLPFPQPLNAITDVIDLVATYRVP